MLNYTKDFCIAFQKVCISLNSTYRVQEKVSTVTLFTILDITHLGDLFFYVINRLLQAMP